MCIFTPGAKLRSRGEGRIRPQTGDCASSSCLTRCFPMKPVEPVTRIMSGVQEIAVRIGLYHGQVFAWLLSLDESPAAGNGGLSSALSISLVKHLDRPA